jgi:hypothetical protein
VQAAEQASPSPIAPEGVAAINQGRAIWRPAELLTRRKLADAWLTWALPDRCASNATALISKSALLGQALNYNNPSATDAPAPPPPAPAPDTTPAADTAPTAAPPPADVKPTDAPSPGA